MKSSVSRALRETVAAHVVPIVAKLGMSETRYPDPIKPGQIVCALGRSLGGDRRLLLTVWCAAKTTQGSGGASSMGLTWRLDRVDGTGWQDLQLTMPPDDEGRPPFVTGGSHAFLEEFHPGKSDERFERALRYLGAFLASRSGEVAAQVPELAADIAAARESAVWRDALAGEARLWLFRRASGEVDPTEIEARVVFVGDRLITLDAAGRRVSFKFPIEGISKSDVAHVSGWWQTPADTYAATVLRVAGRIWEFSPTGRLLATRPG